MQCRQRKTTKEAVLPTGVFPIEESWALCIKIFIEGIWEGF